MDVVHEPGIHTCVFTKSSQVGATETVNNIVGYKIDVDPCSMLVVQPKDDLADDWSTERFSTMVRDTKRLRKKIAPASSRDGGNSIRHKKYEGGFLTIVGANAPANLAGKPLPFVLLDEIDRYPASAGREGDPVDLATARVTNFFNKFIFLCSTPTVKRASRIEAAWEKSDQRRFFVPCPCCGHRQYLKWGQVKGLKRGERFDKEDPSTARYHCESETCDGVWTQEQLWSAVKLGEWIATAPKNIGRGVAGFHIWEIYSPWSSMEKIVTKFLAAKDWPDRLMVWQNTVLGESHEASGESIDKALIMERQEDYGDIDLLNPNKKATVPKEVLMLVGSIDTQKDRLETFTLGIGAGEEMWTIDKREFIGDPAKGEVWKKAFAHFREGFKREDGFDLKLERVFVDRGGHHSQSVYAFTKPNEKHGFFACYGSSQPNKPIVGGLSKVSNFRCKLFPVGTDTAKDFLFARLGIEDKGKGFIHFPHGFGFDNEYFLQLTAEKYAIKFKNGQPRRVWINTRGNKENHALDLFNYAIAAFFSCRVDLVKLAKKQARKLGTTMHQPIEPEKPQAETPGPKVYQLTDPDQPVEKTNPPVESKIPDAEQIIQAAVPVKRKKIVLRRRGGFATSWKQ